MKTFKAKSRVQAGFSLVELLIVIVILTIVFAVVAQGIKSLQNRNTAEVSKLDIVQNTRDFLDQSTRDIHQAGYPPQVMQSGSTCAQANVACRITTMNLNQIIFEGDTNGDGSVEQETIQIIGADGNLGTACPCTLQRGSQSKQQALAGAVPTYYTELGNVLNNQIFTAYSNKGVPQVLPAAGSAAAATLATISTVRMTVNVQGNDADPTTKQFPVVSMTSEARISN